MLQSTATTGHHAFINTSTWADKSTETPDAALLHVKALDTFLGNLALAVDDDTYQRVYSALETSRTTREFAKSSSTGLKLPHLLNSQLLRMEWERENLLLEG